MARIRRSFPGVAVLGLLLLLVAVLQSPAQYVQSIPGELIVGFRSGTLPAASQALSSTLQVYGGQIVDEIPELSAVRVEVPSGREQAVMSVIQSQWNVDYVEPNYQAEMLAEPNDSEWGKQWGPRKIEAPKAWEIVKGSAEILVAVIDTGLDYTHPDLKKNYASGGYDFIHEDNDPYPVGDGVDADRGVAHGSHVAGIIGAEIDNGRGIAGLAQVPMIGVRVLDDEGRGSYWDVAKGIVYAAKAEAKIVNLSLGGSASSKVLESAVNFAAASGVLLVAAAGNSGGRGVSYPAAYEAVIAVSATDKDDNLSPFSSYGPEVELAAPGGGESTPPEGNIYSTVPGNKYAYMRGTSMASPHVAGVAALVWSVNPQMKAEQVRKILCDTADDLGPKGRDEKFGCGRVNAYKAVSAAKREGGEATPPVGALALDVDRGCGLAGTSYRLGEEIQISYTVGEEATVTVYRVGYAEEAERLDSRTVSAGVRQSLTIRAERAGVETLVIQARTRVGRILSQACTYSIGGVSLTKAQIRIDKGCGASYRIGEAITISAVVDEESSVKIIDFATDGTVSTILDQRARGGETVTLRGQVVGPPGQDTLVARAKTSQGVVVTNACILAITD